MMFDSLTRRHFLAGTSALVAAPILPAFAQDAAEATEVMDMSMGNPDAAVTVIEYASFTCPHCASFHEGPFKQLKEEFIDTGKIHFINREIYFDRFGLWAAIVARCGEGAENRYFGIADMIYSQQRVWATQEDPNAIVGSLRKFGKTAGLTDAQLDACFTDAANAEALYARFVETSEADNITSTPSFVINGQKYGNMSYNEMKSIIEGLLSES